MSKIFSGCAPLPAERIKSGYSGCDFPRADVRWPAESSAETGSSNPSLGIIFTLKGIIFELPNFGKLQRLAAVPKCCGSPNNGTDFDATRDVKFAFIRRSPEAITIFLNMIAKGICFCAVDRDWRPHCNADALNH